MKSLTRRSFLAAAGAGVVLSGCTTKMNTARVIPGVLSPNQKLNLAGIGIGGMGRANLEACNTENIVALCDIDDVHAAKVFETYPNARRYRDYRKMLETEAKNIDGVIVATPDHTHAVIGMQVIRMGKHIYLQKPLAHSVYEVRQLAAAAREYKVQTQMGNQGHSSEQIRQLKEWVEDGAIGDIREVHAWSDRPVGGDPWSTFPVMKRPEETLPVPQTLDWDLWLGPAAYRPYHPIYHPLTWRGWWDFGTGPLGDMGCHILDPAFWALDLAAPTSVEATSTHWERGIQEETFPRASIVRYQFPERGKMPSLSLTWYDGRILPPIPRDFGPNQRFESNGAVLVGDKGTILHGSHGAGKLRLLPEKRMQAYKQPAKTIPRVQGSHEQDWIRACKDGRPASSSFEYGASLTEMVLLGVLAMRLKDRKLLWDAANMRFTNDDDATKLLNTPYREGWFLGTVL